MVGIPFEHSVFGLGSLIEAMAHRTVALVVLDLGIFETGLFGSCCVGVRIILSH